MNRENETKKLGRPRKVVPIDAAQKIRELSANGFSLLGVAVGLGTSIATLNRWIEEDENLKIAFSEGREAERHALHNLLYRQAMEKGNATAAMFLLKSRHGYREGDQGESGNRVSINFTLPGALTMENFKVIEHGDTDN